MAVNSARHDLSHIRFEGITPPPRPFCARKPYPTILTVAPRAPEEPLDEFLTWVLARAGLDPAAYRSQPLHRRLPACLRAMKVHSLPAARALLERKPSLIPKVISSLLIGVTEFFREPDVFESLRTQVLPALAGNNRRLRIWSAACSTGAELYSMAILLSEAGLLEHSYLLGTDCRSDAIERAKSGLYDASLLKNVPCATVNTHFEPARQSWRPIASLRRQIDWKVADLLTGVEDGPWDIIFWRNAAIYLKSSPAETVWRQLASVLASEGVLIAGKAERPPADAGLTHTARNIYRAALRPGFRDAGSKQSSRLSRPIRKNVALEPSL